MLAAGTTSSRRSVRRPAPLALETRSSPRTESFWRQSPANILTLSSLAAPAAIIGGLLLLINLGAGDFAIEQKKRI